MLSRSRAFALVTFLLTPTILLAADVPTPASAAPAPATHESEPPKISLPRKSDPAAEKFWQALKLLRSNKPADLAAGRAALQAASDLEFTHAQVLLANCLIAGSYGFSKDAHKGANLFRLAAERGNAFAKVSLGQCLFTGTGARKDPGKAAEWLTAALAADADFSRPVPPPDFFTADSANAGGDNGGVAGELDHDPASESQATAHFLLGQISAQQKKTAEAQAHYAAAAVAGPGGRDGIYLAALQAALNYAFGNGTPRDLAKAHEMLDQSRKLAGRMGVSLIHNYVALKVVDEFATADLEENVAKASEAYETELQFKIASTFADKKSKDYNIAEAVKWYELAAESGQAWAMLSLAFICANGDLGQPDPARAFYWFEKTGGGEKPKHTLGIANLAICHQNGIGTEKSPEKAAALFKKSRDEDIVCYLGTINQCPDHVLTYEQELELNRFWAKEKNEAHAQYLLGVRFLNGYGVKQDFKEAVKWYKKSAKSGDGAGLNELGYLYGQRGLELGCDNWSEAYKIAADYYARAVEAGSIIGLYNLGYMAETGRGMPRDLEKAKALYERCLQLDPNYGDAHNNLANILKSQLEPSQSGQIFHYLGRNAENKAFVAEPFRNSVARKIDPKAVAKFLEHYEAANKAGNKFAAYNLACLYRDGIFCKKDLQKTYGYFETAAERGYVGARLILGEMLEHGEGVPVSYSEAAYQYRLAAVEGNEEALQRLVRFYATGKGVSRDFDRAIFWISILARKGDPFVLIRLGDLYIQNQNYDLAKKLFSKLSDSDFSGVRGPAYQRLSVLYDHGWGVAKDLKRARSYREKALQDGNLRALHDTAMALIDEGKKAKAVGMLEEAARRGMNASRYQLGTMCLNGDGVTKDTVRGIKLLNEAANDDLADAQMALAALTLENTPGSPDLEAAIQLARAAAANGQPKANELVEKLELRRRDANAAPEEATRPRTS